MTTILLCSTSPLKSQAVEEYKEFSDALSMIHTSQEAGLLNNGLTGKFNAHITKLVLSKHGYNDNQDNQGISITINRNNTEITKDKQTLTIEHD